MRARRDVALADERCLGSARPRGQHRGEHAFPGEAVPQEGPRPEDGGSPEFGGFSNL